MEKREGIISYITIVTIKAEDYTEVIFPIIGLSDYDLILFFCSVSV